MIQTRQIIIVTLDIIQSEQHAKQNEKIKVRMKNVFFFNQYSELSTGTVVLEGGQLKFRVSGSIGGRGSCGLPLARSKCEELANYYLGFNGWSSQVMYHRKEDICPGTLCYVTVVKLSFPQVTH